MKFLFIIISFKLILLSFLKNASFINNDNNNIDNAIYIINSISGENVNFYPINSLNNNRNKNKKIMRFLITKENDMHNENNIFYFSIEEIESKKRLCVILEKEVEYVKLLNIEKQDNSLWNLIPKINSKNESIYYIQNKFNKKYLEFDKISFFDQLKLSNNKNINTLNLKNEFKLIRLYQESNKNESEILKNEPIDVLITYVDLSDKNYISKVPRINKDKDNQELKYSVRSILQNIPWIRKIYILMPNEKVSFFKPIEEIYKKIVYIKDQDYLGYNSASSPVLQFNLFKMKDFGISENFILMDDDNFIAQPLEKTDFFYEENGQVFPCLITSEYKVMVKNDLEEQLSKYLSKNDANTIHSTSNFYIQQIRTLLLMYKIFGDDSQRYGRNLIEPTFTHNATPLKLSDIEELHNIIEKYYPFANETLAYDKRTPNSLQMQTAYTAYVKNQYDRKAVLISSAFYDLSQYNFAKKNDKKLFVINKGINKYSPLHYERETELMIKLFPNKTKYELDENENLFVDIKNTSINSNKIENEINKIITYTTERENTNNTSRLEIEKSNISNYLIKENNSNMFNIENEKKIINNIEKEKIKKKMLIALLVFMCLILIKVIKFSDI